MTRKKSVLTYMNEVTARSMIKIMTNCTSTVRLDQDVRLETHGSAARLENSSACVQCVTEVNDRLVFYEALRAKSKKPVDSSLEYQQAYDTLQDCATRCKTLVLRDASQTAFVKTNQNCVINSELASKWAASVSAEFNSTFYNNTDIASAILGATRESRKDKTKVNYLTRTTNRLTAELATRLMSNISVTQNISINGSAVADRVHQDVLVVALSELVADEKIHDDVLTESEWASMEKIYEESTTIGPLGTAVGTVVGSIENLVSNTLGAIMITVMSVLVALVLALLIYVIVVYGKR
jgi:hypothetical protein